MNKRNHVIDLLRILGVLLVMLAHCAIPNAVFELRQFDVTLLVFVSGMSYALSSKKTGYLDYVMHRFKRLILPVWIALTVFFVLFTVLGNTYSMDSIIMSYALIDGIGYVWIFRVLFITALINPLLKKYSNVSYLKGVLIAVLVLCLNELVYRQCILTMPESLVRNLLKFGLTYTVSYGVLSYLGMLWIKADEKERWILPVVCILLFIGCGCMNRFAPLQEYKYPPMLYYISYGLMISSLLYIFLQKTVHDIPNWMSWLSKNSLTVYLMHIFALNLLGFVPVDLNGSIVYILAVTLSILFTWMLERVKDLKK